MRDTRRYALFGLALALIWVATYWLTDRPEPRQVSISFGQPPDDGPAVNPGNRGRASAPATPAAPVTPGPEPIAPPPRTTPEPVDGPTVIPPSYRNYTIERGDTARIISRKVYGTDQHWLAIQNFNPTTDFNHLRAGRTIKVPVDPGNIQGLQVDEAGQPVRPPAAPRAEHVEYIVESGDTLSSIARALYGKPGLWTMIRDANRDQVNEDGTNLRKGMVLRIPPPPAGAR